jgi:hypothetical protein
MYQPYPGGAQLPEMQRPPAPASVRSAVKVMYAGAVASLIGIVVDLTTLSATKRAIAQHFPKLTTSQVNGQASTFVAGWIAGGLIAAGLWIFIAQACKRGKNWARTTGTVLFGIATVQGAPSILVVPAAALVKVFWLVIWLIGLAAVVYLWQGSSSAFFAGPRS